MRFVFMILSLCIHIFAIIEADIVKEKDSFITEKEYGENLYKNPRGIGCNKCHGKNGEGMIISKYKHKGKEKVLKTSSIKNLSMQEFENALQQRKSVMPKYFLTFDEIQTLYTYLHTSSNKKAK